MLIMIGTATPGQAPKESEDPSRLDKVKGFLRRLKELWDEGVDDEWAGW